MLNNASDYKFVDCSQIIGRINGNIMPVVSPSAHPAPLYFEDYLFLLEGYYERMNVELSAGTSLIQAPVRTIRGSRISPIRFDVTGNNTGITGPRVGQANNYSTYINPNVSWPDYYVHHDVESWDIYANQYMSDFSLSVANRKQPYTSMAPQPYYLPHVCNSDFIRAMYYDLNNCRCMHINTLEIGDFATSAVSIFYNKDGQETSRFPYSLNSRNFGTTTYYSSYQSQQDSYDYLAHKLDITYKDVFAIYPYATAATFFVSVGWRPTSEYNNVWLKIDFQVDSGGVIKIPNGFVETAAGIARNALGIDNKSQVYATTMYMIVKFDFPASLDGITWNWQPTYT